MYLPSWLLYGIAGTFGLYGLARLLIPRIRRVLQMKRDARRERRRLWADILLKEDLARERLPELSSLLAKYRLVTSTAEFRAEVIDRQIDGLAGSLDLDTPRLFALIQPCPEESNWYRAMDQKYNPARKLDWIEQGDRLIWLRLLAPIYARPRRLKNRLMRRWPKGTLEEVRSLHAQLRDLLERQDQLIGALDYAVTPSVNNGKLTPVEFRDVMMRGQKQVATKKAEVERRRQQIAAAKARFEDAVLTMEKALTGVDLHPQSLEAARTFAVAARGEIIELDEQGVKTDKLIQAADLAARFLREDYPTWASEVSAVEARWQALLVLDRRAKVVHHLDGLSESDLAQAAVVHREPVSRAWAHADWTALDAALQQSESLIRAYEYDLLRMIEQATGMTEEQEALSHPLDARRQERAGVRVSRLGTTVDPSIAEVWKAGDGWKEG